MVTLYSGKVELGAGALTAITQIAAEKLSVPFGRVTTIQGDTAPTPNQGPTHASLSIQDGGVQIWRAAATAREAFLDQGASKLGIDKGELAVRDDVITPRSGGKGLSIPGPLSTTEMPMRPFPERGANMTTQTRTRSLAAASFATVMVAASPAFAEMSATELAKLAQNPVGNLISLPFQNNTNLNFGPEKGTQNVLNIQPVIPIEINKDWNVITRTIVPVIWNPSLSPSDPATSGIGDTVFTAFLSPADPGHWIWGAGPVLQLPTNTNAELGNKNWGAGPSAVVLHLDKGDPWVYGVLVNNIWSLSSNERGGSYNNGLIQPFVNYNFKDGVYLTSSPILTVNWKADSNNRWTVPLGGGIGKIFHIGKLPVNTSLDAYYNVVRPDDGPNWQIRFQIQLMFPK